MLVFGFGGGVIVIPCLESGRIWDMGAVPFHYFYFGSRKDRAFTKCFGEVPDGQ